MITSLVVAVLLFTGPVAEPGQARLSDDEQLAKLEDAWNQAHLRGDADALASLWAEDFVAVVPKMRTFSRADALATARSGRMKFERYETSDVQVRLYGDAAVSTGRLKRSRVLGSGVRHDDWQFTKFYIRRQGQWQVVAFHASDAPE